MENLVICKISDIDYSFDEVFNKLNDEMKNYINSKRNKEISLMPYHILSKYIDINKIKLDGHKPVHPDIYFNISNKNDYICVIISSRRVGIDIEQVKDIDDSIIEFCKETKDDFFYKWTLKEAYLKMLGKDFTHFNDLSYDEIRKLNNIEIEYKKQEDYIICVCKEKL